MKRDYGIVFQSYALFPNLTIAENVAYGLVNRAHGARRARGAREGAARARRACPTAARSFPRSSPAASSSASRIARAIATSPGLLLLDEPLSALDARVRVRLRGEIRGLQQRLGITTILVTHDQEEALSMADRIVVMNQGAIDQIGTPAEVYRDPRTPFVADFVGKTNLLPATRAGDNRVQVGAQRFDCEMDGALGDGAGLRVFFRPEDVIVRGVGGATPNSAAAVVEKVEFLGAYSRLTFRMNGIDAAALRRPLGERHGGIPREARRHPARGDSRRSHAGLRGARERSLAGPRGGERLAACRASRSTGPTASATRCCSWRAAALAIFLLAPMVDDPGEERRGQGGRLRGARQLRGILPDAGAARRRSGTASGSRRS